MKKGIASILLVLYVAFSCGVVINYHYCMNEFDSLQLGDTQSEVCGKCGMHTTDANSCCNDEVKIYKIQSDQQVASHDFKFNSPAIVDVELPVLPEVSLQSLTNRLSFNNHSPPLSKQDTYLQNCVFRI